MSGSSVRHLNQRIQDDLLQIEVQMHLMENALHLKALQAAWESLYGRQPEKDAVTWIITSESVILSDYQDHLITCF